MLCWADSLHRNLGRPDRTAHSWGCGGVNKTQSQVPSGCPSRGSSGGCSLLWPKGEAQESPKPPGYPGSDTQQCVGLGVGVCDWKTGQRRRTKGDRQLRAYRKSRGSPRELVSTFSLLYRETRSLLPPCFLPCQRREPLLSAGLSVCTFFVFSLFFTLLTLFLSKPTLSSRYQSTWVSSEQTWRTATCSVIW